MSSAFSAVLARTGHPSEAVRAGRSAWMVSGRGAGMRVRGAGRAAGRGPGLFGKVRGMLLRWRERQRQRRALAALSERDLADLGIPIGLALYEAGRWPWQNISPEWRALGAAPDPAPPRAPSASHPPRPKRRRAAPLLPFPSPRRRA